MLYCVHHFLPPCSIFPDLDRHVSCHLVSLSTYDSTEKPQNTLYPEMWPQLVDTGHQCDRQTGADFNTRHCKSDSEHSLLRNLELVLRWLTVSRR